MSTVAVCDWSMVAGVKPSLAAAAILRLACHLLDRPWVCFFVDSLGNVLGSLQLSVYTTQSQHSEEDIEAKAQLLIDIIEKAVRDKNAVSFVCIYPVLMCVLT